MVVKLSLLLLLAVFSQAEITEEEDVLVITDANIQEALDTYPELLIEFYAPWCGHCKKLAPEYAKAAKSLKARDPPIRIAKCDATENKTSADKYGVRGFPSIKYFMDKDPIEYTGGRTADSIINWIQEKLGPATVTLTNLDAVKEFTQLNKAAAVLFAQEDSAEATAFKKAAKVLDGKHFAISTDAASAAEFEVKEPALVLFKQYDDKRNDFSGNFDTETIKKWIDNAQTPWIMTFDQKAMEKIFTNLNPGLFVFRKEAEDAQYKEILNKMAPDLRQTLAFVNADLSNSDFKKLGDHLGVDAKMMPVVILVEPGKGNAVQKFKFEGEITEENLRKFVASWQAKQLEPYIKSDPIPENPLDGNVRVLVGKNFEEVVYDKNKDVFVEFYAPWCGHCKKLAPDYEKVAAMFKDVDSVVVAKMDSTTNEAKGHPVKSFPTLKFFPANNKRGIPYDGARDAEGISKFIKEKGTSKFDKEKVRTDL